jgi:hypothetical protein
MHLQDYGIYNCDSFDKFSKYIPPREGIRAVAGIMKFIIATHKANLINFICCKMPKRLIFLLLHTPPREGIRAVAGGVKLFEI